MAGIRTVLAALRGRAASGFLCAGIAGLSGIGAYAAFPTAPLESGYVAQAEEAKNALDPNEWRAFKLASKESVTHNTQRLRFSLPDPDDTAGIPVASCLLTRAPIGSQNPDGTRKFVIRPFTPTSPPDARGHLDLVVKGYPQGKLSKHIVELEPGDVLEFKGPVKKFEYAPNMKKHIGMVAGGSGLTPALQVASEVLRNPQDKTRVSLVFANQTSADIILRRELDDLARRHDNFKVYYVVDRKDSFFWRGGVGFINRDMAAAHLPAPGPDTLVLVCGPPPMMKALSGDKAPDKSQGELTGLLKEMGYTAEQVFKF